MTPLCVWLSAQAQEDLRSFPWHDERELAGALFGQWTEARCYVDRAFPNPGGPQEPTQTTTEWDRHLDDVKQLISSDDDPRQFIAVGNVHSHPTPGKLVASGVDLDNCKRHSAAIEKWASLIVAPVETWSGGYPALDWVDEPIVAGWIGLNGHVFAADILREQQRRKTYA